MRRREPNRNNRKTLGATVVEAAIILPVLLLTVFGLMETGNIFKTWLTVQKAAQTGTRFAATGQGEIQGNRLSLIKAATEAIIAPVAGHGSHEVLVRSWEGMTVSGDGRADVPGEPCDTVEVRVLFDYRPMIPYTRSIFSDSITLTGSDRKVNEPWNVCGNG